MNTADPPELYIVRCAGGKAISIGKRQAEWLDEHGYIERLPPHPYMWAPTQQSVTCEELDKLVFEQRELRECDFCMQPAGGWLIPHEPVKLSTLGPTDGEKLRVEPFICCDRCIRYVHEEDEEGLVNRSLDRLYARAHRQATEAGIPIADKLTATTVLRPQLRGVVAAMFGSMQGDPIRDE